MEKREPSDSGEEPGRSLHRLQQTALFSQHQASPPAAAVPVSICVHVWLDAQPNCEHCRLSLLSHLNSI